MSTPSLWSPDWPGPLTMDQVHVVRLVVDEAIPLLPHFEKTLASDELDRAAGFHFRADRDRYVAARGALRAILARYLGLDPRRVRFDLNRYGKPLLTGGSETADVSFNVSHTQPLIALAFARGRGVGVDVELIEQDLPHLELAQRFFSGDEVRALRSQPAEEQVETFFAIWTRKEAYMKGRGQGFSIPSRRFTVSVDETVPRPVEDNSPGSVPGSWWTAGLETGHHCAGAVAVEGEGWEMRQFDAGRALSFDPVD